MTKSAFRQLCLKYGFEAEYSGGNCTMNIRPRVNDTPRLTDLLDHIRSLNIPWKINVVA